MAGLLVISRKDGSRVASLPGMSNVVKYGETINLNIVGGSKNASLPVVDGSPKKPLGTIKTDKYGNGNTSLTMNEAGNRSINVIDTAMSTTHLQTVWVQDKPTTTGGGSTPSGSQTSGTTPTTHGDPNQPTQITVTDITPNLHLLDKAKEIEEWFRRNLIPVLVIALSLILVAVFAGTKAGRKAIAKATGAPIKR